MHVIIWDFDGTLGGRRGSGQRGGAWTTALWEVLQNEIPGCNISLEQLRPYMRSGFPWHQPETPHTHIESAETWWQMVEPLFFRAYVGVGCDTELAQKMASCFRETYLNLDQWFVYDDVLPVFQSLAAEGWNHVLLSNHVPELGIILSHFGLSKYFYKIFNSANMGYEKPNPQAFNLVLHALPDVDDIWMVGDNIKADVEGASKLGISAILVRRYHPEAQHYAETLYDVRNIISAQKGKSS